MLRMAGPARRAPAPTERGTPMAAQDTALVLEGGGFRCMFTAGVLDVLMELSLIHI